LVFGGDFDPKRAQAAVERFALLLGPMVGAREDLVDSSHSAVASSSAPSVAATEEMGSHPSGSNQAKPLVTPTAYDLRRESSAKEVVGEKEGEEQAAAMRALREAAAPILTREMEHVNSTKKMDIIHNQISDIRKIMEKNVEMILDRQEQLESLEEKSSELMKGSSIFRKRTRALRRWHLRNQIKWGVAIGTMVSVAVALPIVLLAAA